MLIATGMRCEDAGKKTIVGPASVPGFTLVEVVVATAIAVVAILGLAPLAVLATRATLAARHQTSTTLLAIQKMEQLRSLAWGFTEGSDGLPGAAVADLTTDLAVDPPGGAGTGLSPSPANTLALNTPGYVDYVDEAGAWIGTGASPPSGTVYIRRWSIVPLPADPADTLVLQVRVVALSREVRRQAGSSDARLEDETRLVSVRTRKAM